MFYENFISKDGSSSTTHHDWHKFSSGAEEAIEDLALTYN